MEHLRHKWPFEELECESPWVIFQAEKYLVKVVGVTQILLLLIDREHLHHRAVVMLCVQGQLKFQDLSFFLDEELHRGALLHV